MFRCPICQESLRITSISALACGHTFHFECIVQWLERSKTCPSCRRAIGDLKRDLIDHVFLEAQSSDSFLDSSSHLDVERLESRCQYLDANIAILKEDVCQRDRKLDDVMKKYQTLETEKTRFERNSYVQQERIDMYKQELKSFKNLESENETLKRDNARIKKKLESMEKINLVINGTDSEATDAIENLSDDCFDQESKFLMATLKSQLREKLTQNAKISEENRKLKQQLKDAQKGGDESQKLVKELREEVKLLRTRPNQTPFNPALKEILKDTPIDELDSPVPLHKRLKANRLINNYEDFKNDMNKKLIFTDSPTSSKSGQQPLHSTALDDDDFPLFALPLSKGKRKDDDNKKEKVVKRSDGLGGSQRAFEKPMPLRSARVVMKKRTLTTKENKQKLSAPKALPSLLDQSVIVID